MSQNDGYVRDSIGRFDVHSRNDADGSLSSPADAVVKAISDAEWARYSRQDRQHFAVRYLVKTLALNGVDARRIDFTFDPDDDEEPMFVYQVWDEVDEVIAVDPEILDAAQQFANVFRTSQRPNTVDRRLVPTDTSGNNYSMFVTSDSDSGVPMNAGSYSSSDDASTRSAALANPATPADALRYELDHGGNDPQVLAAIASNPNADDLILFRTAAQAGYAPAVRALVLEHPNVTEAVAQEIANTTSGHPRIAARANAILNQ